MRHPLSKALLCLMLPAGIGASDRPPTTFQEAITVTGEAPLLIPVDFGQAVLIDFRIGELEITVADSGQVRTELRVLCKDLPNERCDSYRERLQLVAEVQSDRVSVRLIGLSGRKLRKLDIDGRIIVPRWAPLEVRMGIGELDIDTSGEKDLSVDMSIGELTIHIPREQVSTVELGVGIGDAWVQGEGVDIAGTRHKLLGARAQWLSGTGAARVAAHLGIGEAGVVLEEADPATLP
jgi:hypothetical protein